MAIVRTAGTEIIRCQHFTDVDGSADTKILIGEQHHIYTVLSIIIYAETLGASTSYCNVNLVGYDSKGGTTAQTMRLFRCFPQQYETFVWNDKFSFNGFEPTDFTGTMDAVDDQNAIADQGSSVAQYLVTSCPHANDSYRVFITYIDQNNA
tara:strand:+ start:220 stop:672 length:453 start_codon:yes stop_codon:yes gene_type:complete